MTRMNRAAPLALALALVPVWATGALALVDAASGFGVRLQAPFTGKLAEKDATEVRFAISSRTGKPEADPREKDNELCRLRLDRAMRWAGAPQPALNRPDQINARQANLRGLAALFDIEGEAAFTHRGVPGLELDMRDKTDKGTTLSASYIDVPQGRVSLTCVTTAGDVEGARRVFRALRAKIILPRR